MAARPGAVLFRACVAGSVVAAVAVSGSARADEPVAPEADTRPDVAPSPSTRPKIVLVGAAVTAGWYGAAVGMSYLWPDADRASALRIPVAGPYMALAKAGCGTNETTCDTFTIVLRTILTGLSAVGQTGGVLAMLEGAFVPTSSSARAAAAHRDVARKIPPQLTVVAAPGGSSGAWNFGVAGSF